MQSRLPLAVALLGLATLCMLTATHPGRADSSASPPDTSRDPWDGHLVRARTKHWRDASATRRATPHPHGTQFCASGCVASHHPTPELSQPEFERLLERSQAEPLSEDNEALETLLYYGRQARVLLETAHSGSLDAEYATFLRRELSRSYALVSFRLVDERGAVRGYLPPTRVPLDVRHEFVLDVHNVQPLVASGTVKRVGLDHLWTRI